MKTLGGTRMMSKVIGMRNLQHVFPSEARQATQNVQEVLNMTACERFEVVLSLISLTDDILSFDKDGGERMASLDRMEQEEMRFLAAIQRTGHV